MGKSREYPTTKATWPILGKSWNCLAVTSSTGKHGWTNIEQSYEQTMKRVKEKRLLSFFVERKAYGQRETPALHVRTFIVQVDPILGRLCNAKAPVPFQPPQLTGLSYIQAKAGDFHQGSRNENTAANDQRETRGPCTGQGNGAD